MKSMTIVEHDFTEFFVVEFCLTRLKLLKVFQERELKNEETLDSLGKENRALKSKIMELEKALDNKIQLEKYRNEIEMRQVSRFSFVDLGCERVNLVQAECLQRFGKVQGEILQYKVNR